MMARYHGEGPDHGKPERRGELRREVDEENQTIGERAVEGATFASRLTRTARVATSVGALTALVASGGTAIGMRWGPKQDLSTLTLRVDTLAIDFRASRHEKDSVFAVIRDLQRDIKTTANLACISARARNPETAKAAGCDQREP
jgi:hypothetical protein